jgi:hypothetical protein
MNTFNEREKAFEKRFAHDEELRFKALAKRNKLLGLWAAEKLGKSGAEAEAYAQEVMKADLHEPGEEDLVRKLAQDFKAAGQNYDDTAVRRQIDEINRLTVPTVEQVRPISKI